MTNSWLDQMYGDMLNFILPILKNPLTRMIGSKVIGGIQHKMEKDKIIRAKEIQAANSVDIQKVKVQLEQVKQQEHSYKDEWLCIFFTISPISKISPISPM